MTEAATEEPAIRGSYISPSKAWIIRTYGAAIFEAGLQALPPEDRGLYAGELVSLAWYPLRSWTALLDEVRRQVQLQRGESEETFDRRHMFESISGTMQKIYRVAFGLFSPTSVISKMVPYFNKVYNYGAYEVLENQEGHCVLRFKDAPVAMLSEIRRSFPLAASWMLDMAGQEVTRMRVQPRVLGSTFHCDLDIEYQSKKGKR
jgi:hypothetical protein